MASGFAIGSFTFAVISVLDWFIDEGVARGVLKGILVSLRTSKDQDIRVDHANSLSELIASSPEIIVGSKVD